MSTDELLTYLFDGQSHVLFPPMATWLASRRFMAFVTAFRSKIRKKLRGAREQESLHDLRLELETAYLLLRERSLSVVYEPQGCEGARCPDYAVTFTTSLTFMLEVTRQRPATDRTPTLAREQTSHVAERLGATVCGKLGQLSGQHSNVLIVGLDAPCSAQDLHAVMLGVQHRAERNDPNLVARHGFRDRADFFSHYRRLSEVLVRPPQLNEVEGVACWVNPQARRPLPTKVRTALLHSHTAQAEHEGVRQPRA
ncbi:MAG: hypothetical protein AVDCRST_MAG86-693 [uncultured Truepera sp.]|uniref:Uncharacterized protein n=1 Tax=uncultured Truepera sp. TaxID=543023 RepID=A0A6J4UVZ7_9DEIN|nr:MAG: hypothetical protein AVDCRST_MAG86-693 [uncultured Truepera sp.]